jgi:peptidoglycan/xylan/chitin deacetylase (PgdA/CDA1 family)
MKFRSWLASRNPEYLLSKARTLLRRYGLRETKAVSRTTAFIAYLAEHGGAATLFAPATVLERYPKAIGLFREAGIEIGMHGWEHVDLRSYPVGEARQQLLRATQAFTDRGMAVHGFRCPYLSHSDALVSSLPAGVLQYSSNASIWWDVVSASDLGRGNAVYDATLAFYAPRASHSCVSIPWQRGNLVEIPVSLPDDMLLFDGIFRDVGAMTEAWRGIMAQTYRRGELFNLIFHPELADREQGPFGSLLAESQRLTPPIWATRLCDVSDWWQEKRRFVVVVGPNISGQASGSGQDSLRVAKQIDIRFEQCSKRATILFRGLSIPGTEPWDGKYSRLRIEGTGAVAVTVPAEPRPFVGVTDDVPEATRATLRELGYILETKPERVAECGVVINQHTLDEHTHNVALVEHIEATTTPLVRFWPWPDGTRSALCFSGDLDALSLLDYAARLWPS